MTGGGERKGGKEGVLRFREKEEKNGVLEKKRRGGAGLLLYSLPPFGEEQKIYQGT